MTAMFRLALSGDFRKGDGLPAYPDFNLVAQRQAPAVEMAFVEPPPQVRPEQIEKFDALMLLVARFGRERIRLNARLGVVARQSCASRCERDIEIGHARGVPPRQGRRICPPSDQISFCTKGGAFDRHEKR